METVSISELRLDRQSRVATWKGRALELGDRSFDALARFVESAPEIVSKADLADAVWPGQTVSDETVSQRISLLRKAFRSAGEQTPMIKAVHGRGYVLIVPEAEVSHGSNEDHSKSAKRPGFGVVALGGLAVIGVVTLALSWWPAAKPQVLVHPESGDIWMGTASSGPAPFPVRAQLGERSVLINSTIALADLDDNPIAQEAFCRLARDRSLFSSTVPKELADSLDEARSSPACQ